MTNPLLDKLVEAFEATIEDVNITHSDCVAIQPLYVWKNTNAATTFRLTLKNKFKRVLEST